MKQGLSLLIVLSILTVGLGNCTNPTDNKNRNTALALFALATDTSDELENSLESAMDSLSEGMTGLTDSSGTNIAYLERDQGWLANLAESVSNLASSLLMSNSLYAASTSTCPGGGDFSRSVGTGYTDFPNPSTNLFVRNQFNNCFRYKNRLAINGSTENYWQNLSSASPYLQQNQTQLQKALQLQITNQIRNTVMETTGTGSQISNGQNQISHTYQWTNVNSSTKQYTYTLNFQYRRTYRFALRTRQYDVTSPTPLTITADLQNQIRTISSGEHQIQNQEKTMTMTFTYNNFVWSVSSCFPNTGSVSFSYKNGTETGTGKIEFDSANPGIGSYSYTSASGTMTGKIYLSGC